MIKLAIWHNEPAIRFSHGNLKLDQVIIERVGSNFKFWEHHLSLMGTFITSYSKKLYRRSSFGGHIIKNILRGISFFINGVKMGALPYTLDDN